MFQGAVIGRQGDGLRETFTVRKVSYGVGVERTFPVHAPSVAKIEVVTRGDVRRAKLYYLRDRVGKAAKIKEKRPSALTGLAVRAALAAPSQGAGSLRSMSTEDLERYEAEIELQLYKEYKDVAPMFTYVVETERRFYLANEVDRIVRNEDGRTYVELQMRDAWVWDMYRTTRFVVSVSIVTFKDVNIEELPKKEL